MSHDELTFSLPVRSFGERESGPIVKSSPQLRWDQFCKPKKKMLSFKALIDRLEKSLSISITLEEDD